MYEFFHLQKGIDFPCEQWFSDTKGDKQTKRALYPKGKSTDQIKMAEKGKKFSPWTFKGSFIFI